jgi:cell wall-associated NlpC family hydrolase
MYAAYLANQIDANWIRRFYQNALSSGVDPNITIGATLGWSTSLPQYPHTAPSNGQLLFYYDSGDPYPGHVAIFLGGDQAISLWNQPNNVDSVQRIQATDLSGTVYIGNPPW